MRYFTPLILTVLVVSAILSGCDKGLDPNAVTEPGFGGMITYIGPLPPSDSLKDLRIVAVPYFPVDTLFQPLILKVIDGVIPFSGDIRSGAESGKSVPYEMFLKPQTYYYIAIVQQFGLDVFSQWKVVSVYQVSPSDPTPKVLKVEDGKFISNINFTVDFYRLPPQPFRVP
jgi:hypothetical protein